MTHRLQALVDSRAFNRVIEFFLLVNFFVVAMTSLDAPRWVIATQAIGNTAVALVFAAEMTLKIVAFGPCTLFLHHPDRNHHIFDFVVTAAASVDLVKSLKEGIFSSSSCRATRIIRGLRVVRLLRGVALIPGAAPFMKAIGNAVAGVLVISVIFMSIIFNFAFVGVSLFGDHAHVNPAHPYANFKQLDYAMQLLFIVSTGDKWEDLLITLREDVSTDFERFVGDAFFLTFVATSQFLMMNLFVTIIVEAYEILDDDKRMTAEIQIPVFLKAWQQLDPDATGVLHSEVHNWQVVDAERFGVCIWSASAEGAIALSVDRGSEAEAAGMRDYTTVIKVDGKKVTTEEEFRKHIFDGAEIEFIIDPLEELLGILPPPLGIGDPGAVIEIQCLIRFIRAYHSTEGNNFTKVLVAVMAKMLQEDQKEHDFQEHFKVGKAYAKLRRMVRNWKIHRMKERMQLRKTLEARLRRFGNKDVKTHVVRARLLTRMGELEDAANGYRVCLDLDPEGKDEKGQNPGTVHHAFAQVLEKLGHVGSVCGNNWQHRSCECDCAVKMFHQAVELDPTNKDYQVNYHLCLQLSQITAQVNAGVSGADPGKFGLVLAEPGDDPMVASL